MGSGGYDSGRRSLRASSSGYFTKNPEEIFSRTINIKMDSRGVKIRECLDSTEHPFTTPIIIALDVTGSMGSLPHFLVKEGLPLLFQKLLELKIPDPEVLFLGIGDHECDQYPLQVGQFESSDELLDKWLTSLFIEGGGGGNSGESYLLAWYLAAFKTKIDSLDKRKQKGILITIGDEPCLRSLPDRSLQKIFEEKTTSGSYSALDLLNEAKKKYEVYHLHLEEGSNGKVQSVKNGWKEIIGDHLIVINDVKEVAKIIPKIIQGIRPTLPEKKEIEIDTIKEPVKSNMIIIPVGEEHLSL